MTLIQSSCLTTHFAQDKSEISEEQSRLIWSAQLLDYICGQQQKIPSLIGNVDRPIYQIVTSKATLGADLCPPLPLETRGSNEQLTVGIWAHNIGMTSLWSEVRLYISECSEGKVQLPWMPDSRYAIINCQILELERTFPDAHRYESAQFHQQAIDQVSADHDYWLPWMRIQVSYHTISCILNHPFLLSTSRPKTMTGTNAFWKSSSQLALLHGTWISRLLQSAKLKKLRLSDPFFTYSAAIAATLHTYWSRATDEAVRSSARKHLDICQGFVAEWGPRWPVSEAMVSM